jgi:hypothetical protein
MNINIAKIKRFNTHSNYFKNNKWKLTYI